MDGREQGRGSASAEASSPAGSLRGLFTRPSRLLPGTTVLVVSCLCPVGLGLLIVVSPPPLVPGLGTTVNGSTNWLRIGGLQAQPSELFKPILAVWFAVVLARLTSQRYRPRELLLTLSPVVVAAGLIVVGGDLGTTLVLML